MESSMSRSTAQACAACKYQRRKCSSNCILAPYFPHDRQRQFLNAHRLFGVGKITKLLKPLNPLQRDMAMSTIMFQSDMRAQDPVGGCYKYILHLQSEIDQANAQLHDVLQKLAFYRSQPRYVTNNNNVTSQPFPFQPQFEQQQHVNYNASFEEDHFNFWALQNSMSLLPLSLEDDVNQDLVLDQDYDQKPVPELMNNIESDSIIHPRHSDDESVLSKVDKAVL